MDLLPPAFESTLAISQQFGVIAEIQLKMFFRGLVEFAPVIVIIATNLRTDIVDCAGAVGLKVLAAASNQQVPTGLVAVYLHAIV